MQTLRSRDSGQRVFPHNKDDTMTTMTKYKCFSCGAAIDSSEVKELTRCPYCGGRILIKKRPEGGHHVKAG